MYCSSCWWSDEWDGTEYAIDYDPSRPFLAQVKELTSKTPWQALEIAYLTLTNSDYVNAVAHMKNCYLTFWADYCENVFYSTFLNDLKDSLDCYRMEKSELCYESIGCHKCYRTFFSEECDSCTDVWFSRNCAGCTNCFGCINMRNKNYCIFNEQYSREDYFKKLEEFQLSSRTSLLEMRKRVYVFWNEYPRRSYSGNSLNVNVSGDYIYESRNARDAYMATGAENSRFVQFLSITPTRDSYDYSGWGNGAEQIYESAVVGEGANNVKFSDECWPDTLDVEYSIYAIASKHIFGCVNLKRKSYCILNKQYSREDFEALREQVITHMNEMPHIDSQGRAYRYGDFFPIEMSPFGYNASSAQETFPLSREEAKIRGYKWKLPEPGDYTITIPSDHIPDSAGEIPANVIQEVLGCAHGGKCAESCSLAFRVTQSELDFYHRMQLPLPNLCPNCRHYRRTAQRNPLRLWDGACQCAGAASRDMVYTNTINHFHGTEHCPNTFQTSYSPERKEIVYCEACYNAEVV